MPKRMVQKVDAVLNSDPGEFPPGALEDIFTVFANLYRTDSRFRIHKYPSIKDLQPLLLQWPVTVIGRALTSDKFVIYCMERGIPYIRSKAMQKGLTAEQMYCVSIMLDMGHTGSLQVRLRKAGISYAKYQTWMKDPIFKQMIEAGADSILQDSYLDINRAMVTSASKGDVAAAKFVYELTGRYDPNSKQIMQIEGVLGGIIEILQKHVQDPETLTSIALDLQMLATRAGITGRAPVAGEVIYGDNNEIDTI